MEYHWKKYNQGYPTLTQIQHHPEMVRQSRQVIEDYGSFLPNQNGHNLGRHIVREGQSLEIQMMLWRALLHLELWQLRPSVGCFLPVASLCYKGVFVLPCV